MRPIKYKQKDIVDLFYKEKVLTKKQLFEMCGFSNMTSWRMLSEHGYISSYNFNAKYYTLIDIPVFDKNGLWSYRKVRFSKCGSLTNTVIELIFNSRSGLEKNELQKFLGVNPIPILSKLYHKGKLNRKKVDGLFVYLQTDEDGQQTQLSNRRADTIKSSQERLPEPERIIAVLVELIQRVELQPQQLARRLARKGIQITLAEIQAILQHYQLTKKNR
ncbi:MAG: hypothetical protein BA871_08510 [Desulfuromonadales bacterium C00003096]|jgi:hypothetical protein|nr:MAG: hypothetical protein BA871_08510 [Desulfuromonadales bacterium C00003096]